MKRQRQTEPVFLLAVAAAGLLALAARPGGTEEGDARFPETPEMIAAGKRVYDQRCWWCHGERGLGDGPSATRMYPRPRDFVRANYRLRTTPFGALPTGEDLFRVVARGMPGTPMPGWEKVLSEEERWQVVYHLKTLSPRFGIEKVEAVRPARVLPVTAESIARGESLFQQARCFLCHGSEGRGDGGIVNALSFEWGIVFRARDLTKGWTFKGGSTAEDIFTRITTGLNGTPMGSYADLLTEEQRWDLTHYVRSLDSGESATSQEFVVSAAFVAGDLPETREAEAWERARPVMIPLGGQILQAPPDRWWTPTVGSVDIRAVWNGESVAFLMEWNDPTGGKASYPDSAFLQFPVYPVEEAGTPYFVLGDSEHPVDVWHWEETGPGGKRNGTEQWLAEGSSKITLRRQHDIRTIAGFKDGRRYLVLSRAVQALDPKLEVDFEPGRFVPLLVSIQDGANAESENVRALSTWLFVSLEKPRSIRAWLLAIAYGLGAFLVGRWLLWRVRGAPV